MKSHLLAGLLSLVCLAPAFADTIKVGIIAPISGPFSTMGKQWEATVKAYQKINGSTAGGHTVEVIWKDLSDINPAQARALAQELVIKDKVQYIGGLYFTPDAMSVAAVAQEAKIPTVIFNAGTSSILDKSEYMLRTSNTLGQVSVPAARRALDQKLRSAVTLVADYGPGLDAETSFVKAFTEGGGKIVDSIRAPLKTTDFGPFMQRIKAAKPDVVYVFGPGGPATYGIIKGYAESGLKQAGVRFLGSGETSELDLPAIGDSALGLETMLHYSPAHPSALNEKFLRTVQEVAPGTILNSVGIGGYDGMAVIYHMIEATKGQRDPGKAMAAAKGWEWESPRGPLKIDPVSRDLIQNVYVRVVEKDATGLLRNREIMTYPMQPDYGRVLVVAK
jgi:branched-chain amino acid transport system substrate-binding protein